MVGIPDESQEARKAAHHAASPLTHRGITLIQETETIAELLSILTNLGPKEGPQIHTFFFKTFFILDLMISTF